MSNTYLNILVKCRMRTTEADLSKRSMEKRRYKRVHTILTASVVPLRESAMYVLSRSNLLGARPACVSLNIGPVWCEEFFGDYAAQLIFDMVVI